MRRRVVAAALVAGALAGAVGAAVKADDDRPGTVAPSARPAAPAPIPVGPIRDQGRLPDGRYDPGFLHLRVHRPRIALQLVDPGGGPDWAVRVFDAERLSLRRPSRTLAGARVIGRERCVQLGRLRGATFGWVYGDGRFRRVGHEDRLIQCTSRRRPELMARFDAALAIEDPAAPRLAASVLWGYAPGEKRVRVVGTGGVDGEATTGSSAFLRVGPPEARPRHGARVIAGGDTYPLGPHEPPLPPRVRRGLRFPTPIPGTEQIEGRAPDPSGGPGYGVEVAKTREGQPCAGFEGRVVGERVGDVDLRLALFSEGPGITSGACRPLETAPTRDRPCDVGTGYRDVDEMHADDAFLRRARIERRLLPGRTFVRAQCHPDVETVTLQTPRDVRTLVPSPVGRVILAVYDGDFPAGGGRITARFRDGRTWSDRLPLGF